MKQSFSPLQSLTVAAAIFLSIAIEPAMAQLQPRLPGLKLNLEQLLAKPGANRVVIKFREGSQIRLVNGRLISAVTAEVAAVQALIRQTGLFASLHRLFGDLAEAQLTAQREEAQRISGRVLADLNLYFVLPAPTKLLAAQLAAQLNLLPIVEFADLAPVRFRAPAPAGATPDFTPEQGYKNLTQGIGVLDPAKAPGSDGSGMSFVDVEYSWQLDHEDLKIPASRVIKSGTPYDYFNNTDHGTAVLGEIVGLKNAYGVTGIAPAAMTKLSPAETKENGYDPATAILLASNSLNPGDVIVIEQQYPVCGGTCGDDQVGCGPLETIQAVHDVIANVTALNRIVVAAAGNGNVNLDDATCNGAFDRSTSDSGAIMVGAGHSTDRTRLDFSSYGTRVDVQGWGENIVTTGYGNDAFGPSIQRRYTRTFGGTSGATPIVAGAVLAIQGRLKACHLPLATPTQMRQALTTTGTQQPASDAGHIGPLPHIAAALSALGGDKCITPPGQ
jgi:serine protease